jgi:cyclophilin family peptidyl-prolyl cis-trans isomerase
MNTFRALILCAGLMTGTAALAANPLVEMKTNMGSVTFELYPDKAPRTVENFMKYVKSGFYQGTVFHRVVDRFVVQGGGLTPDLQAKPTLDPIPNEATNGLKNEPGTLAMARAYDPNSATSQFFVNLDRNLFLNHHKPEPDYYGYCVFGKVVKGMDVLKRIGGVPTGAAGPFPTDVPLQPVVIEDVSIIPVATATKPEKKRKHHG